MVISFQAWVEEEPSPSCTELMLMRQAPVSEIVRAARPPAPLARALADVTVVNGVLSSDDVAGVRGPDREVIDWLGRSDRRSADATEAAWEIWRRHPRRPLSQLVAMAALQAAPHREAVLHEAFGPRGRGRAPLAGWASCHPDALLTLDAIALTRVEEHAMSQFGSEIGVEIATNLAMAWIALNEPSQAARTLDHVEAIVRGSPHRCATLASTSPTEPSVGDIRCRLEDARFAAVASHLPPGERPAWDRLPAVGLARAVEQCAPDACAEEWFMWRGDGWYRRSGASKGMDASTERCVLRTLADLPNPAAGTHVVLRAPARCRDSDVDP